MTHVMRWALIGNTCVWSNMCTSCVHHRVYVHIYVYFVCVVSTESFWCIVLVDGLLPSLVTFRTPHLLQMYTLHLWLLSGHFCLYTCTYSWSVHVLCCSLLVGLCLCWLLLASRSLPVLCCSLLVGLCLCCAAPC